MWKNEDIEYAQLLNNLWKNKIVENDFSLFKSWFLSKWQINLFQHYWDELTYIVPCNELKEMINNHIQIEYNSKKKCCLCYTIVAQDNYKNKILHELIQFNIRKYVPNSNINKLYTFLKLYRDMKVMLINNLYLKFGLINGTTSIIHKILIKTNNSTFTNPFLYVFVNFNTFITNHSILKHKS